MIAALYDIDGLHYFRRWRAFFSNALFSRRQPTQTCPRWPNSAIISFSSPAIFAGQTMPVLGACAFRQSSFRHFGLLTRNDLLDFTMPYTTIAGMDRRRAAH